MQMRDEIAAAGSENIPNWCKIVPYIARSGFRKDYWFGVH
jgi:hypothetical protein